MNVRKNNGITLIALVITIIVLLILAGVSVMTLSGDNGLINRTIGAKNMSDRAEIKEQIDLAIMDLQMDGKEKNAENVKGDLIESNAYLEEEIEVLSSSKIKIKGEEFELLRDDGNEQQGDEPGGQPGDEPVEGPEQELTLEENVNLAKEYLEGIEETVNTKSIKSYLISENIYTEEQIEVEEKDDFIDILKVGEESVEVSTNRHTVYFEKPDRWDASSVYAYIWYENSSGNDISYTSWPGTQISIESAGSNIYKFQLPECAEGYDWEKIIFNNGSENNYLQTNNSDMGANGQIYRIVKKNYIYARKLSGWNDLNLYTWVTGSSDQNHAWPGESMTYFGKWNNFDIYYYDMDYYGSGQKESNHWKYFIVNDGSKQTVNIDFNEAAANRIYCLDKAAIQSGSDYGKYKNTSTEAFFGEWFDKE